MMFSNYNCLHSFLFVLMIWSVNRFDLCETKIIGKCIKNLEGSRCGKSEWQHDTVCLWDGKHKCHTPNSISFKFSLDVRLEQKRSILDGKKKPSITKLWIKGSGPGLSLEKPVMMQKSARTVGTWQKEISYAYDSNALLCVNPSHCSLNQRALEFRVYRDELGKDGMLGPNFFIPLPLSNSMSGPIGISETRFTVYPWFDGSFVTESKFSLQANELGIDTKKDLTIKPVLLLPPSFKHNLRKTYPLVIMLGAYPRRFAPILELMFVHEASIKESIVVTVPYLDKAPFCRFNPFSYDSYELAFSKVWYCKSRKYDCQSCQTCWDSQRVKKCDKNDFIYNAQRCLSPFNCIGKGDSVLDFIELKLVPEIIKRTQNRVQLNFPTQRMSIIGYDGGGLLACYAALSRPLKYGNAACISAPFHWPMTSLKKLSNQKLQGIGKLLRDLNDTMKSFPELRMQYATQKYYIDNGEHDNFYFPVVNAKEYSQWFVQLLKDVLHLEMNKNIMYFVVPGAGNSYYHHQIRGVELFNRIKTPLLFFLRSEGGPNLDFPRMTKIGLNAFTERKTEVEMSQSDLEADDDDSTLSSQFNQTISSQTQSHCSRLLSRKNSSTGVPVSVYLLSISISIIGSVLATVILMCLREANQKAAAEAEKEEAELLDEIGSSIEDLEIDS